MRFEMYFFSPESKDPAIHFSYEELFTRYIRFNEPVLMLWQTDRTIMLGNNQAVETEADIGYADKEGIKIVRRSSGGGAIYTDPGTIQYSLIEPFIRETKQHRENLASLVINSLGTIGINAEQKGRNDILLFGKKISGLAQYTAGKYICTHGSLLYDADIDILTRVLIADEKKLHPKGISSIKSRVINIKPFLKNISADDLILHLKKEINPCNEYLNYDFTSNDLSKIEIISIEKYANPKWNYRI